MMGREPEPDDLIVPLPPMAIVRRRSRTGDAFRGHDYSGKKWREHDMPLLQTVADPIAAALEAALALRRSGADPKALRRALRRIEELLDE